MRLNSVVQGNNLLLPLLVESQFVNCMLNNNLHFARFATNGCASSRLSRCRSGRPLLRRFVGLAILVLLICLGGVRSLEAQEFPEVASTFFKTHCIRCHQGKDAHGKVDFTTILGEPNGVQKNYKLMKLAADLVSRSEMPPPDEAQPTSAQRQEFQRWYQSQYEIAVETPGLFRVRRLSAIEYRNTLESLFGFQLQVTATKSEQTKLESSLVLKLLPTDPKGLSGYTNDTSSNPISLILWSNYSYLADLAIAKLFSAEERDALEAYVGPIKPEGIDPAQAERLLARFQERAWRRPPDDSVAKSRALALQGKQDVELTKALAAELKSILMSPEFLYRGLLQPRKPGSTAAVDDYELAERLSYFLWADAPDDELLALAQRGKLRDNDVLRAQVKRMLQSSKARSIAEVFGVEWLLLDEIENISKEVAYTTALKGQPIELLHDLIVRDRPLRELFDSKIEFINLNIANYYAQEQEQLAVKTRREGVELEKLPLERVTLKNTAGRGGLLTLPGVLSMNKGPIQRGAWVLERIMGEHIGEPPPNIPPVKPMLPGQQRSFRERFAEHRANQACALCHDRIDPLGFAFEAYNERGGYWPAADVERQILGKFRPKPNAVKVETPKFDASGKLPTGEEFRDLEELKTILVGSQWPRVVENLVRQMLAYALCRELQYTDEPLVRDLTARLARTDATWGDLIHAVTESVAFQQTRFAPLPKSPAPAH